MQLCGGEGGRLGSGRLAGRIRRPRLTVALVVLGWATWRLGQRTRGAGLRQRDTVTHLSRRAGAQRLTTQAYRVGRGLLNVWRRAVSQGWRVSFCLRVYKDAGISIRLA